MRGLFWLRGCITRGDFLMVDRRDGQNQTDVKLVAEAYEQAIELKETLLKLKKVDEQAYNTISGSILSTIRDEVKTGVEVNRNLSAKSAPLPENDPGSRNGVAPKIVKEGIRSYFQPRHFSRKERDHRNLKAALIEDVILALLCANQDNSCPVIYQDIADELDRLNLHEERNTTYGRISRLRKEGQIADIDPENRNAYFLTDAGRNYVAKMLQKRLGGG
jgi:hypothetical protein